MADDPRWIGATLGVLTVLYTWSRDLGYHARVHPLVTAGGLTDDGRAWRLPANPGFLVPAYALATIFRAKVRDALEAHTTSGTPPLLAATEPVYRSSP